MRRLTLCAFLLVLHEACIRVRQTLHFPRCRSQRVALADKLSDLSELLAGLRADRGSGLEMKGGGS